MLRFADVTIPKETARSLATRTDPATAIDEGYVVKTALNEAFGAGTVRPWRLVSTTHGVYRVVGIVQPDADLRPNAASRKIGIVATDFEHVTDETFDLDVLATPVKHYHPKDPETGKDLFSTHVCVSTHLDEERGIYVTAEGDDLKLAYMQWLVEVLSHERTGMRVIDAPQIISTRPQRRIRKRRGKPLITVTPCVEARVRVMVIDEEKCEAFLSLGLKKMKDLGLGSMIPVDVLEDLAA